MWSPFGVWADNPWQHGKLSPTSSPHTVITLEFDDRQYSELISALDQLSDDAWIGTALRAAIPAMGRANKTQYDLVSQTTNYSPGYIGKLKPSGVRRAGGTGDLGYGKDTLSLYSDMLFNWEVDGDSLTNFSDLAYAGDQEALLASKQAKGEASEGSYYADDEVYFTVMEDTMGDAIEGIWES
jgi:hypothetical protein